jgi:hypothetical protein
VSRTCAVVWLLSVSNCQRPTARVPPMMQAASIRPNPAVATSALFRMVRGPLAESLPARQHAFAHRRNAARGPSCTFLLSNSRQPPDSACRIPMGTASYPISLARQA